MDIRHIRYFVGVCEAGSLSKAAARLHIAQPSLGQQIADLERELGAPLFRRSSRGMQLTSEGRIFLEHARVLMLDIDRARDAIQRSVATPSGDVAIGLPTTVALIATLPILSVIRRELPRVRIRMVEAYTGTLREWLQSGKIDLALLYGDTPETGLEKRVLLDDQLAFVFSRGEANSVEDPMSLEALADHPLILPGVEHGLRRIVEDACAPLGVKLNVVAEIDSLGSVKRATEARLGCTVLPLVSVAAEVSAGTLSAVPIAGPGMKRRVVLASDVSRPGSLARTQVIAMVEKTIHGMVSRGEWPARWLKT